MSHSIIFSQNFSLRTKLRVTSASSWSLNCCLIQLNHFVISSSLNPAKPVQLLYPSSVHWLNIHHAWSSYMYTLLNQFHEWCPSLLPKNDSSGSTAGLICMWGRKKTHMTVTRTSPDQGVWPHQQPDMDCCSFQKCLRMFGKENY